VACDGHGEALRRLFREIERACATHLEEEEMRIAARLYSAGEMARLARCSLTQLEYLSEIQLLIPKLRSRPGQHRYDDVNLLRLQQIRMGRARGLALEEIRRWLDDGAFGGGSPEALPPGFMPREPSQLETDAKVETPADQRAFSNEASQLYVALSARRGAGVAPEDPDLRRWTERHCCYINRWFRPCDARQHAVFGRAMLCRPLHVASIERHGPELAAFMLQVLEAQRQDHYE
jgi:DNA-binding transcriptional MerR regulator